MVPEERTLTGRTAVVTGSARGLGPAYALHLASLGADVAVLDIDLHWNVTANCIAPGYVATGRLALAFEARDVNTKISLNTMNVLGRPATTEDCARVDGFLAGPASDYLTGVVLQIDAGTVS